MHLLKLILFEILTVFSPALGSFSYAKIESPDSGSVLYSIRHNDNGILQENIGKYSGELNNAIDYQRSSDSNSIADREKTGAVDKIWKPREDSKLIEDLFKPGKLAPTTQCNGFFCRQDNYWNQFDECENQPCSPLRNVQYRVFLESPEKRIRFPENGGRNSARLGTRSRELGMSGKLRNSKAVHHPTPSPEFKYVTYETFSLIPENNYF